HCQHDILCRCLFDGRQCSHGHGIDGGRYRRLCSFAELAKAHTGMKSPLLKTVIALVLAATIIGLTMSAAIRRGLDHAVTIAAGDHTTIAISLSDSIYHINLGYLGLKQVADTIYEYWTRDSHGAEPNVTVPNAERLNAGIRAASSLGPQTSGYVSD